jgi:hypothetical protein
MLKIHCKVFLYFILFLKLFLNNYRFNYPILHPFSHFLMRISVLCMILYNIVDILVYLIPQLELNIPVQK